MCENLRPGDRTDSLFVMSSGRQQTIPTKKSQNTAKIAKNNKKLQKSNEKLH